MPIQSSIASNFESILDVKRDEVKVLSHQTDSELHKLYEKELRGELQPFERYVEQLKVLEDSMRDLIFMVRRHCNDQAKLLDKVWTSAADLFSAVCKGLSDKVQDLEHQLTEKTYQAKNWQEKAKTSRHRFQKVVQNNTHVDSSHLRELEEEILLKDKELMALQKNAVNLYIWFPRFAKFSDSVLSRFLPPVEGIIDNEQEDEDEDENEGDDEPEFAPTLSSGETTLSKQNSGGIALFNQNSGFNATKMSMIESQQREAMMIIKNKQVAQDHLLKDLKRLEKLGIGLKVFICSPPGVTTVTAAVALSKSNEDMIKPTAPIALASIMASDEVNALNMGLFNGPQLTTSFSATTGEEYLLKRPGDGSPMRAAPSPSFSAPVQAVNDLSTQSIQKAAMKIASLFQSSSQLQGQVKAESASNASKQHRKKKMKKQVADNPAPIPVNGPVGASMLTVQEFNRLQGRRFSHMANLNPTFYNQDTYYLHVTQQPTDEPGASTTSKLQLDLTNDSDNRGGNDEDSSSGESQSDGEDYNEVRIKLKQALLELQLVELAKNDHIKQHKRERFYYENTIQQLRRKESVPKERFRKARESSNKIAKAVPSAFHITFPMNYVLMRLKGMIVVQQADGANDQSLLSLDEIEQQISRFYRAYVMTQSAQSHHHGLADEVVDYWRSDFLDNPFNGQSLHALSIPLLGSHIHIQETGERKCVYSLLASHLLSLSHPASSDVSASIKVLRWLHSILQMIQTHKEQAWDIDELSNQHEVNAEIHSKFLLQFTPEVALVCVYRMLSGADQLHSLGLALPQALGDEEKMLDRCPSFTAIAQHRDPLVEKVASTANSAEHKAVTGGSVDQMLGRIVEEDDLSEHQEAQQSSEAATSQPIRYLSVSSRVHRHEHGDEDEQSGHITTEAARTVECFDLYLQCFRSVQVSFLNAS